MSSSKTTVRESLQRLEELVAGMKTLSERESEFERARQLRDTRLRQDLAEQEEQIRKECGKTAKRLEREADEEEALIERIRVSRRSWIDRAQIEIRNRVISRIQESEGARKFEAQRAFMEAGKERASRLARTLAEYEEKREEAAFLFTEGIRLEKASVRSLRGFRFLQKVLIDALKLDEGEDPENSASSLREDIEELTSALEKHRGHRLIEFFNGVPLLLQVFLVLLLGGAIPFLAPQLGGPVLSYTPFLAGAGAISVVLVFLFLLARSRAAFFPAQAKDVLARIKVGRARVRAEVETWFEEENEAIESRYAGEKVRFEEGLRAAGGASGSDLRYSGPEDVAARADRLRGRLEEVTRRRIKSVHEKRDQAIAGAERQRDEKLADLSGESSEGEGTGDGGSDRSFESVVERWQEEVISRHEKLRSESLSSPEEESWPGPGPEEWKPPARFDDRLKLGELHFSGSGSGVPIPKSPRLRLPEPPDYRIPLRLRIPDQASVLIETGESGRDDAISFLNYLVLGWLAHSPPGRLSFSLVDPVGLGESFAGLMHLADYEEILINTRIRTQEDQIDQRLGELCDHMEKVIQMYLRSDYETITQYNEAAGTIAERYHFLVVADFPRGFTEQATRRLLSIATSGARCGVFLILHCDSRAEFPFGFQMEDLRKACLCLGGKREEFSLRNFPVPGVELRLEEAPGPEVFAKWVHRLGEVNRDSNRIEVPFSFIAPDDGEIWSRTTAEELSVPIGRSGATKLQRLALGKGTCQHALIAGKTGSGKSTLFHVIVTNLALWCDPDEVEFYLIDFKKGVEFKCYADAQLPHARVVAIESDREFGLSVLQRLDEELKTRGERFRAAGVQDLSGYRSSPGAGAMPRTLLLIDEFQEFFTDEDQVSQQAAVLLDRIVRQGRAFGIHAILGSQTLGGAFTLARATLGQMTVRIALACNEADSYLIMDDSNPAPRLLNRPGEGIYNDRAGAFEANSPFQVVWIDEAERDRRLEEIRERAGKGKSKGSLIVFEGNTPGDVTRDPVVESFLAERETARPVRIFLGAPNAIKGPTEVRFARQSGSNLLIVGQREDVADAFTAIALRLLRKQCGETANLVLIDSRFSDPEDGSWLVQAVRAIGGVDCPTVHEIGPTLNRLAASLKERENGEGAGSSEPTFLFVPSLHRYRKLRYEEDFSFSLEEEAEAKPSDSLHHLITEGPGWGFHVITSLDSCSNVNRCLGRKAAGEFEMKILFQMSATDSASLIDSGAASDLGLSRALFHDEPSGTIEIFRPYAPPPIEWFS